MWHDQNVSQDSVRAWNIFCSKVLDGSFRANWCASPPLASPFTTGWEGGPGLLGTKRHQDVCHFGLFYPLLSPLPWPPPMTKWLYGGGGVYIGITVSICLCVWIMSGLYLLNHFILWKQTWCGGILSWAGLSCRKKIVCYLQDQGHSEGLYDQNMTILTMASELLILLQPNLGWWYIFLSESVLWKNWIAVSKVKVTVKPQDHEHHWMFIQTISSGPLNCLSLNLVHHHEPECHAKRLVCILQGQSHS